MNYMIFYFIRSTQIGFINGSLRLTLFNSCNNLHSKSYETVRNSIKEIKIIRNLGYNLNSYRARTNDEIVIKQARALSSTSNMSETVLREKYKPRECRFETPYGHIAALEWGRPEAPRKILCMHGWLDNAGSFERIIPFILNHNNHSQEFHIIALDDAGVGLSSHRPPGALYTTFATVMDMKRITQKLKWDKITLLSHSLGAHISFIYSCIYPSQVESFISIDLAHPIARLTRNWNVTIANSIDDLIRCDYNHEDDPTKSVMVPVYSEEDALKRLMDGHSNSLTRESAEVIMKRGATKQRWGYTFNRDVRLRHMTPEFRPDDELMMKYMSIGFRPNLLIIRAASSVYQRPESTRLQYYEIFNKNCPMFRDVVLEGTHHLHMNTPDTVAVEINKFLSDVGSTSVEKIQKPFIKSKL